MPISIRESVSAPWLPSCHWFSPPSNSIAAAARPKTCSTFISAAVNGTGAAAEYSEATADIRDGSGSGDPCSRLAAMTATS